MPARRRYLDEGAGALVVLPEDLLEVGEQLPLLEAHFGLKPLLQLSDEIVQAS